MKVIESLAQALTREKGFQRLAELTLPDTTPLSVEAFDFIGIRSYWGSITSIALVTADRLTESQIQELGGRFCSVTKALAPFAGKLQISTAFKTTAVKLASYGILCFVFEGGCRDDLIAFVQKQKRGDFSKKEYALFWVVDAQAGRVYAHRWLPFGVFPGRKYLESVLQRGDEAQASKAA